jgi:hypothetical protein
MSDPNLKDSWSEVGAKFGEAFEQLGAALRDLGKRLTGMVHDEELRGQAKQAGDSFEGAMSKAVDTVGEQVDALVRKVTKRASSSPVDTAATDDPAVTGVPEETPEAVRPSATGLVTGPLDTETDIVAADVHIDHEHHDDQSG